MFFLFYVLLAPFTFYVILGRPFFPVILAPFTFYVILKRSLGISRKRRTDSKLPGIPEIKDFEDDVVWGDILSMTVPNNVRHSQAKLGNLEKQGTSFSDVPFLRHSRTQSGNLAKQAP